MKISKQTAKKILNGDLDIRNLLQSYNELKYRIGNMGRSKTKGRSKFKGVDFDICHKQWRARITENYNKTFLGYFDSEIEAAKKYDEIAILIFGEYAKLNCELFPDDFSNQSLQATR